MARELLEGESLFEELTPELLRSVFSSEAFSQRIGTLHQQQLKGEVPFGEQRFHVLKPSNGQAYVSPLVLIGSPPDTPKHFLSSLCGLRQLFRQSLGPADRVSLSPIIMVAHTHPPWSMSPRLTGKEPMITPSAYDEESKKGDLYLFLHLRLRAPESIVARRLIQIIIAQGIHSQFPIELLLIQESDRLWADKPENILPHLLLAQKKYFPSVRSQEDVIAVLRQMKYQVCHIALSEDRFVSSSLFSGEDLEKISQFAY